MDSQILAAQEWLNSTYAGRSGWVDVPEDGMTGWSTIYGLRRGLQAELGISPLSSGFGAQTTAQFVSQIGQIDASSDTPANILRILSGALFCKGYPGIYIGEAVSFDAMALDVFDVRNDLGLPRADPHVDVKLMASLLSMDAYTVPFFGDGTEEIREIQRWMNGTYIHRRDFAIVPCDGIFSRQVQTALLYAMQYEIGMADGTANGNFGPATRDGIKASAIVRPGDTDFTKAFVRLYQAALRFNRYEVPFDGQFFEEVEAKTKAFQAFMELNPDGTGNYPTWCALLVSSGDTSIKTKGLDTNKQLNSDLAFGIRAAGYTHVGRYTVGSGKHITSGEMAALRDVGLRLFPLHQRYNNEPGVMTRAAGLVQGIEAVERGRCLGLPAGGTVFFSVDFDAQGETIHGPVLDFFRGVNDAMDSVIGKRFEVGVYGTRNVCQIVTDEGLAGDAFVAGMSTGWSGNMGFPMPANWDYNQIVEVSETFAGVTIGIDHVVVSSSAAAVDLSAVTPPPTEKDGSSSATGFDTVFEWVVRAEVSVERSLKAASTVGNPLEGFVISSADYILDVLRKPDYGDGTYSGLWGYYLVDVDSTPEQISARKAAEEGLAALAPTKPETNRDVAHWAATVLGYRTWEVPTAHDNYGLGDLGGWMLDLLSAYGVYSNLGSEQDLMTWMTSNVGANDASGFGYDDVVADADAWLIARALRSGAMSLSNAMRDLYQLTSAERIRKFYAERFGSSEDSVAAQFKKLADGIDAGGVNFPVTDALLQRAAGGVEMPNDSQAAICGRAYARVLAQLGE